MASWRDTTCGQQMKCHVDLWIPYSITSIWQAFAWVLRWKGEGAQV